MNYPWYQILHGPDLEQGDILESCPVFLPRAGTPLAHWNEITLDADLRDVIVMTQSCDLTSGREKVSEVLLCALWHRSQLRPPHFLATAKGLEEARRGALPRSRGDRRGREPDGPHRRPVVGRHTPDSDGLRRELRVDDAGRRRRPRRIPIDTMIERSEPRERAGDSWTLTAPWPSTVFPGAREFK